MAVATLENVAYRRPRAQRHADALLPRLHAWNRARLVAEVLDELGVRERTIGVSPVGCAVFAISTQCG